MSKSTPTKTRMGRPAAKLSAAQQRKLDAVAEAAAAFEKAHKARDKAILSAAKLEIPSSRIGNAAKMSGQAVTNLVEKSKS